MAKVLIPGRHLITTQFMVSYLESLLQNGLTNTTVLGDWKGDDKIDHIIIPVTNMVLVGEKPLG